MKKSVVKTVVALVVLFTVSAVNVNAKSLPEFLYNTYEKGGKVTSKQVCKLNPATNTYTFHLVHEYTYTNDGSLLSNKTLRWNKKTNTWENSSIITYEHDYLTNSTTLNYAEWNKKKNAFDAPSQKAVYQYLGKDHLANYVQYEKEKSDSDWQIKTHFSMNNHFVSQLNK